MSADAPRIDRETVVHVARLARLSLSDVEVEQLRTDLGAILAYVEQLDELALDAVEPTTHLAVNVSSRRPDEPAAPLDRDVALSQAPRPAAGGFAVPAFVEE